MSINPIFKDRQDALEFNMIIIKCIKCIKWLLQKVLNMWLPTLKRVTINPEYGVVTFSQFYLKLNNLFVRW